MENIRKATPADVSRIAEILIFTKRTHYRAIFCNDIVSFGEMQVYPLAKKLLETPDALKNIWVYDDAFVKGMLALEDRWIRELYVDPFFQNQGIGSALIEYAVAQMKCSRLWVLEKNTRVIDFYLLHGFLRTGERKLEEGTAEYVIRMER